jgi:hypothetical protein
MIDPAPDAAPTKVKLRSYGAIALLTRMYDPRILLEGPADTGKSSGLLRVMEHRAWAYPGIRVLLLRQTMQSLRESTLATLEDKVWAPMMGGLRHPAMHGTAQRASRRTYQYPNGTTYVIGGLEDPGWTFSMEYDQILGFEAWEFSRASIEKLYRANRNHVLCRYAPWNQALARLVSSDWMDERWMRWHGNRNEEKLAHGPVEVRACAASDRPGGFGCWQQIIFDTNPSSEFHHLNQMAAPIGGEEINRIKAKEMPSRRIFRATDTIKYPFTRLLSRHEDNPACTDDDLAKLDAMIGHRHANLRLGLWVSAEGQIWPSFDPTVHMVSAALETHEDRDPGAPTDRRPKWLRFLGDRGPHLPEKVELKWCFASQDLGWRNAACLQVWGVDYDDRIYRMVEIHRREQLDDWWTDRVLELWAEFDLHAAVLDCEDPERVVKINDRLAKKGAPAIAQGVDKSVRRGNRTKFVPTSLDLVREMLNPEQKGGPRMYWLRDALREGRCPISSDARKPCSSEEEIPGFVFREHVDGQPDDEEPDKAVPQDGCAATRYAAVYQWLMDPKGPKTVERFPKGTAGWRMGHEKVLKQSQGRLR